MAIIESSSSVPIWDRKTRWERNCPNGEYYPLYAEPVLTYGGTRHTNTSSATNDKITRVKPSPQDLILYPTNLPEQFRRTVVGCLCSTAETQVASMRCYNSTWSSYEWVKQYESYQSSFIDFEEPDMPSLDWALPLRLKIKAKKVNLAESLFEYRETTKMLGNFTKGMKTAWNLYRGRLPKSKRRKVRPCDVPAAYLTTVFGVEPLVRDVFDSVEALKDRLQHALYHKFAVTVKGDIDSNGAKGVMSQRAIVYLEAIPGSSNFSMGNPLELAWEVTPFSWMIDYGIQIGDFLSALDALDGWKFVSGTVTTKVKYKLQNWELPAGYSSAWNMDSPTVVDHESHVRGKITSIPLPSKPTYGFSKSWRHLQNSVAVLATVNKRCKKA